MEDAGKMEAQRSARSRLALGFARLACSREKGFACSGAVRSEGGAFI